MICYIGLLDRGAEGPGPLQAPAALHAEGALLLRGLNIYQNHRHRKLKAFEEHMRKHVSSWRSSSATAKTQRYTQQQQEHM